MRRTTAATCAALITALGAGCATSGTSETEQADANTPAAITWWSTGGDDESAAFQKAADLYTKSHPDVTIKVQTLAWDDAYAKLLAASTSRSGPDIISGGMTWTIQFGLRGGMVDLRKYGIEQLQAQAQPAQWKSAVSPDGTIYGIPLDMSTVALYYRTDLFEKAGIKEPPKTWEELTADIEKLKKSGVKTPFSIDWGNLDWIGYFNFLYQAGGAFYTPDCKPSLDTPQAEQALSYWIDLHRKYGAPTDTVTTSDALDQGIAMVYGGNWNALGIDTSKPAMKGKWAIAPLAVAGGAHDLHRRPGGRGHVVQYAHPAGGGLRQVPLHRRGRRRGDGGVEGPQRLLHPAPPRQDRRIAVHARARGGVRGDHQDRRGRARMSRLGRERVRRRQAAPGRDPRQGRREDGAGRGRQGHGAQRRIAATAVVRR